MAELVKVETKKPAVEKITVTLTASEATDLAVAHERYYGANKATKLLKEAVAGNAKPLPTTFTDYLTQSVMSNSGRF